ncbi:MAG: hypothetical protein RRY76_02725 [Clostridia bacterium]
MINKYFCIFAAFFIALLFFAIFLFSPSLHDNANTHSENHSFDSENSHFAASNYTNSDLSYTTDFSIDASKNEKEVASIICSDRITIKSGQTNALITFQNPIFSKYSVKFKIVAYIDNSEVVIATSHLIPPGSELTDISNVFLPCGSKIKNGVYAAYYFISYFNADDNIENTFFRSRVPAVVIVG